MLEIEMKFPVEDFAAVESALRAWNARGPEQRGDADRYYNAPDRDFGRTDEALRVRSIGHRNFLTYKGPKTDATTKTRLELEAPLGDGSTVLETMQGILQNLGYRFVALVEKNRTLYHLRRSGFELEVCLDEVKGLGKFVELEIVAPAEQLERARAVVQDVAAQLGLGPSERRAYLQMQLEKNACT